MKFKVNREKLLKCLQRVNSVVGTRSTMAVLSNVLLEADEKGLALTTSDVEIRITTHLDCEVETPGVTTVPARKFLSLVSCFVEDEVQVEADANNHVKLDCGTSSFTLLGLPPTDFPEVREVEPVRQLKIKENDFKRMLNSVTYAVSAEDSRKVLTGVLLTVLDGCCTLVATDGKRLAIQEQNPLSVSGNDGDSVVPLKAANELKRLLEGDGELEIVLGEKQCVFRTANFTLTSKLIEGNYPNYRQVIPPGCQRRVEIEAAKLLSKIEMVSQVLSDSSAYVVLSFRDNQLRITGSSSEIGAGSDVMEVKLEGEPFDVSFKPSFLADPLRVTTADRIVLKVNDPFNPVAMEGHEGFLYVIMPIRNK